MAVNIKTTIGNIELETPFMNASGCWCYSHKELEEMNASDSGAYITKTMTMAPRKGNPEPRYYHNTQLSVNSMGLPNLGFSSYMDYGLTYNYTRKKPLIFSISSMSYPDTKNMISQIPISIPELNIKGVEFNISCPNIVGKGQMGYDIKQLGDFLDMISTSSLNDVSRNDLAIGLKMSPYFDKHQFGIVADLIKQYPRLDFLTCINGIGNGLVIDTYNEQSVIKPNSGCGGLGGSIVKPIGLSNVKTFKSMLGDKVDIIGCGGVTNGLDAFEYFLAGASAVAVGTQLVKESPSIFTRLNTELQQVMDEKQYTKIGEFKNKLNKDDLQNKLDDIQMNTKMDSLDLSLTMC